VLLIGPTGSGKTPLGDLLEKRGLGDDRCRHFDFGTQLRAIVQRNQPDHLFSRQDLDFLRQVLQSGALLENERFPIAQRILQSFLSQPGAADAITILNGLPRHVGQAEAVERQMCMEAVVYLHCTDEIVRARIGANVGGDRTERQDDDLASVRKKLLLFAQRTSPLVERYRHRGVPIFQIDVTAEMSPEVAWQALHARGMRKAYRQ
jgi:adenylate kinase family enzyme